MLKKYPFTKQEGLKDCAAASVSMIVKYYKGFINITKLNEMLKINRNGTTAYHIVNTLKELGFNAYGIKEALVPTKIPFIAHVILNSSYKHFLVIYEVNKRYVIVADPADRIKKITIEEFKKIWTGIKICAYPIKPIFKEKNITFYELYKNISPKKSKIILIFLLSIIITILSIFSAFFFQSLITNINQNNNYIKKICMIFIILIVLNIILNYLRNKLTITLVNHLDKKITTKVFTSITKLPYHYYQGHTTGEIATKLNDLKNIKELLNKLLITIFIDLPLSIFAALVLLKLNQKLFILLIIISLLYCILIKIFNKKLNKSIDTYQRKKENLNSFMIEAINSFETIKGINIESKINKKFKEKNKAYLQSDLKLKNIINLESLLKDLLNVSGQTTILIVGILEIKNSALTVPTLITYNAVANLFIQSIRNIIDLDYDILKIINYLKRALAIIKYNKPKAYIKPKSIEYRNVNFSYDDITYVLKNINLKIKSQSKILITGKSGSGKSTMLKLLKNYYENYEGKIMINGKSIQKYSPKINYISLKDTIFTGSVEYNLKIKGSKKIQTKKEICYTDEIINDSFLKYNLLLEENGFNISSGQKQRIVLARALQNFDILIIDEALSNINSNLERKILKKLIKVYHHKTIIFITHRLDNLDLFDRYIKLENGQIVLDVTKW